jgi:hypothetical protein
MSGDPAHRDCPPYFNYGVIFATRAQTEAIGRCLRAEIAHVDACLDTWFKSQIAHTLATTRLGIRVGELALRDNFPLHVAHDEIRRINPDPEGRDRDEDIRIFHYLGHGEINKDDFESSATLAAALERDVSPPARRLQALLRDVLERIEAGDASLTPR